MSKRSASTGHGSLATGAVTAFALAVQAGLAVVVGVIIARELGLTAETDGFFAAYGVFVVIALMGNAIRVTMLPAFARARIARRLGAELVESGLSLTLLATPLIAIAIVGADALADALTGEGSELARSTAAEALPWMVGAGCCQVLGGLAASGLAALDDYATAALGFVAGSAAGLAVIGARIESDGVQAVAWGMVVNGAIAVLIPSIVLARRARSEGVPVGALRPSRVSMTSRLRVLANGVTLPLALQAIYVICLPLASREGEGAVSSFGFAYLLASAVVAVTASSLGLVTAVPLTRTGLGEGRVVRHVVASAWIGVVAIGFVSGILALAGGTIVEAFLGSSYGSGTGAEIGRLAVVFAPWAIAAVGISVTFPLLFVHGRGWWLPLLGVVVIALQFPLAWFGQRALGLNGIALSLAVTTWLLLVVMLAALGSAQRVLAGLGIATATVGAVATAAFLPPWAILEPVAAALLGALLYVAILAALRPPLLRAAWRYLRALT